MSEHIPELILEMPEKEKKRSLSRHIVMSYQS